MKSHASHKDCEALMNSMEYSCSNNENVSVNFECTLKNEHLKK